MKNVTLTRLSELGGVETYEHPIYDPLPVPVIPRSVTMRQARLALLGAGLLAQVDAAIAAMPGDEGEAARIEWEYAQEVHRDSPLVAGLSEILGFTDEAMDNLYRTAAGL